ncbi:hypothetical protein ACHHYP_06304 [Achlya hypogyna]|uniref:Uncharacterized protein n=1 Tax=Achlya hypogyna TaxID=1202772 RepID=A0A1V9YUD8_ACHHY|nr:hypothetical protein ACHHYP_06304 [Achlya hypogyna]
MRGAALNLESGWCSAFLDVGFDQHALRKGRWPKEEEAYAVELIRMVHANHIALKFRQSLESFLAQKLHSDEMRVLKKIGNSKLFAFERRHTITPDAAYPSMNYENKRTIEPLE